MASSGERASNRKMDKLQSEVDEVTNLLKDNVDKVLQRGDRLERLEERSEDLNAEANRFRVVSTKLKKKYCWQNCKMTLILTGVILLLLAVIAGIIVGVVKPWESGGSHNGTAKQD
ncbi:vesicle-associated membrane protein 3-like [Branchiostoma lanceolatum]|uniref:vesicle-associated membrane protein 3-like n=1 Tax=Branchiostoma lanceolatum TaxID=7740 RepID=UPI003455CC0B